MCFRLQRARDTVRVRNAAEGISPECEPSKRGPEGQEWLQDLITLENVGDQGHSRQECQRHPSRRFGKMTPIVKSCPEYQNGPTATPRHNLVPSRKQLTLLQQVVCRLTDNQPPSNSKDPEYPVTSGSLPNIVVVTMDCVSADAFRLLCSPSTGKLPFATNLQKECLVASRALAPASWTLPSTASLLTGLYPWQHGVFGKIGRTYAVGVRSLPAMLSGLGYTTLALSGNPLLSNQFSPMREFEIVAWGSLSAQYLRTKGLVRHPNLWNRGDVDAELSRAAYSSRLTSHIASFLQRNIGLIDAPVRVFRKIQNNNGGLNKSPAPWIDPLFQELLRETPSKRPVFVFVNLMEAHEPYVGLEGCSTTLKSWIEFARHRQDRAGWLTGRWYPSQQDREYLESLYLESILGIDAQLRGLIESLKSQGRWQSTVFILTSDHGQTFREGDPLYHAGGVSESLLRIPLWIRGVPGIGTGSFDDAWVSLVDVLPTIAYSIGLPAPISTGVPLQETVRTKRRPPVLALSDGLVWTAGQRLSHAREHELNNWAITAYQDDYRGVIDLRNGKEVVEAVTSVVNVGSLNNQRDKWPTGLLEYLRRATEEARHTITRAPSNSTTDARLSSWGYI